jgi:hypothetical protein
MPSQQRSERVVRAAAGPDWGRPHTAAAAALVFLLAAIVGMTSTETPWQSGGSGGRSTAPAIVGEVLVVLLAVVVCVLVALVWILTPGRRSLRKRRGALVSEDVREGLWASFLVLIAGVVVLGGLVAALYFLLGRVGTVEPPTPGGVGAGTGAGPSLPPPGPASPVSPIFHWFVLGLLASTAILVPVALVARHMLRERGTAAEPEHGAPHEQVVRAVEDSIDDIERDPDARRAVIRAYARMERAFGDAGIPREPSEAPFEFVGRSLQRLRVSPASAGRLAELFERARFSRHAVDAATKQEALRTLREVQGQIGVST